MKIVFTLLISLLVSNVNAQQNDSPKLVVGIVVDQMCYEYLYRYYNKFCDGGFKLMMEEGTNCRNTNYDYIPTYTGPGHASIYTGTTPNNHGIVGNDWYDRTTNGSVNCVQDSLVQSVGTVSAYGMYSPINLKSNTITDQLKMTYPGAKVVSMSIKNRGAILPGGHLSDGSYWYDYATGKFITSSYFQDELPEWVSRFNKMKQVENYLTQTWAPLLAIEEYTESGPDDSPYEHSLLGKTSPTFPYNLSEMTNGVPNYELFVYTPFSNTYLTDFALASIEGEGLGQDDQTDMLCISYSTPDIVGHAFGPYSIEIEDLYLRLDLDMKNLIEMLEEKVGKHEFTIFLTADHAVVPVPQYLMDNNLPGGYFFLDGHMTDLRAKITEKYGQDFIEAEDNLNIYLHHDSIKAAGLDLNEVAEFVAAEIQGWEGVKRAFTGSQLYNASVDDQWMDMVRKGYHHAESGDVLFILEPGFLPKSIDSEVARRGTSHGSAYNYDTHVPLLWYGKGIPTGEIFRTISITDIAATLSHILYLQNPNSLTGSPIIELLER
ncbi:MAG: alkaline phosphatase family protein [Crocinitomicaceae bacterium]|nr:alkaline phosphatase family protein [Crocinitomicaceae bacterium]